MAVDPMAEVVQPAPSLAKVRSITRRVPFTIGVVAVMLLAGVATGSLWRPLNEQTWFPQVAYGLDALLEGRWWTPVTGAFFALVPVLYVPVAGGFALLVGITEWRLGTKLTAAVCVAGHLIAVVVAALVVLAVRDLEWPWAQQLAPKLDVGFSAGMLACAAVLSASIRPPWRLRIRAALCIYVTVSVLFIGTLADLEHLVAVAVGLPLGPALLGRHRFRSTPSRREWRLLAVTGLLILCLGETVIWLFPATGPLGSTEGDDGSWVGVLVNILIFVLIMNGLRKGRRVAWWVAVVLAAINAVVGLAAAVYIAYVAVAGGLADVDDPALSIAASVLWAGELWVLIAARRAFRAPMRRRLRRKGLPGATTQAVAKDLLVRHGGGTMSWMTTWHDNLYFLTDDEDSFIAYQRHANVAVSIGNPIGPPGSACETVTRFASMCERTGLTPCLFSVTAEVADDAVALGWQRVQIAEDTLLDLEHLEFKGKSWQDVRSALNRAGKEGITYREVTLAEQPWALLAQVRAISEEWVGDKGLPEMGFTLGGVDEALDPDVRVGLAVDGDGSVHGVMSWLPVHRGDGVVDGWTLDVMRRRTGAFRPVIEFLIASACLSFKAQGARFVSLSGAPLARSASTDTVRPPAVERMLDALGASMEPIYGFRSLHAFKAKFSPRYEPIYMAYRDEADLPRIGIALTKAYLPTAKVRDLVKLSTAHA